MISFRIPLRFLLHGPWLAARLHAGPETPRIGDGLAGPFPVALRIRP